VGYNPISGESYATKTNENESTAKKPEEENSNGQVAPTNTGETGNGQTTAETGNGHAAETGNGHAAATNPTENKNVQKAAGKKDDNTNENNAQKNVHTSVRVVHPPGGKSNGPLW